jgi:hypothetical protein
MPFALSEPQPSELTLPPDLAEVDVIFVALVVAAIVGA